MPTTPSSPRKQLRVAAPAARRYDSYDVALVQDCNLRCRYCSAGYGRWGGRAQRMSSPTMHRAIAFMVGNGASRFSVSISGGEPLLDFPLLRQFVDGLLGASRRAGRKVAIGLATNGTLLTREIADYLVRQKVRLTVSLDGDRRTTDRNRRTRDGRGVYDRVVSNLAMYRDALERHGEDRNSPGVECTIDDAADLRASVLHLFRIGFSRVLARPAACSRFTRYQAGRSYDAYLRSFTKLADHLLRSADLADVVSGGSRRVFRNIEGPLLRMLTGSRGQASGCAAMISRVGITAEGKLVPCHLFNGRGGPPAVIGDVASGVDRRRAARLLRRFARHQAACASCRWRALCDGVCHAEWQDGLGGGAAREEKCRLKRATLAILAEKAAQRYDLGVRPKRV